MNKGVPGIVLPKVYVPVKVSFDADGNIIPTEITWENGTHYLIDKVTKVRRAAAMRSGGQGDQYTIMVGGRESFLYFERDSNLTGRNLGRWFVARKQSRQV